MSYPTIRFKSPDYDGDVVVIVQDKKIEVYVVDEHDLEEYQGSLDPHSKHHLFCQQVLKHVAKEVRDNPLKKSSAKWLSALDYNGLLEE